MEALDTTAEDYFRQMALDHSATRNAWQHILTTIDTALSAADYNSLWTLIPYIEEGDGHLAFQYIGKTHRLLRILNILKLEAKYHKILFCQGCGSFEALWEKYMLTLFAFRRILFRLSGESLDEAAAYLQSHPVSHLAAYMMVQDELILPDQAFYETLSHIYTDEWSAADIQQFSALAHSCTGQEAAHGRS